MTLPPTRRQRQPTEHSVAPGWTWTEISVIWLNAPMRSFLLGPPPLYILPKRLPVTFLWVFFFFFFTILSTDLWRTGIGLRFPHSWNWKRQSPNVLGDSSRGCAGLFHHSPASEPCLWTEEIQQRLKGSILESKWSILSIEGCSICNPSPL